ncbi:MAG: tetratricopeptide repeat protein [Spongiibacteraceae bacterium]
MAFINIQSQWLRHFLVWWAMIVMSACQFNPGHEQAASIDALADSDVDTVIARLPNPYLTNLPTVNAQAKDRFAKAEQAVSNADWLQAEQHLLWLIEHYPDLSGPYVNLAMVYGQLGQQDKQATMFERAINANGNNIYAYNEYGVLLREQGDFTGAEQRYKQALTVWPDYPEGHLNLAILYDLYMGKLDLALQHYQSYKSLLDEPSRQLDGWIIDLQRRMNHQ